MSRRAQEIAVAVIGLVVWLIIISGGSRFVL